MYHGKPTVVVSKMGGVQHFPDSRAAQSVRGEILGETIGMIKRLVDDGYHVVYYGKVQGTPPEGMTLVEPPLGRLGDTLTTGSTVKDQDEVFAAGEATLRQHDPDVFVQVLGMEGTSCYLGATWPVTPQASQIRYMSPQFHAVEVFNRPRICVNNDPRSYPKIQEMSKMWLNTRPCALLSQRTGDCKRVIGGVAYDQREVYAGCQDWWKYGAVRPDRQEKTNICDVVAHAHIADGCRSNRRDYAWQRIFSHENEELWSLDDYQRYDIAVYGKGWEYFTGYVPEVMPGVIQPHDVMRIVAATAMMPCVSPSNRFYTSKASMLAWYHCAPLFYGRGEEYTYDAEERVLPLDHWSRVSEPGDLDLRLRAYGNDVDSRDLISLTEHVHEHTTPWFDLFDNCVNEFALLSQSWGDDWRDHMTSPHWWEDYGGLRHATT
jgi:hypothetical protein